MIDKSIFRMFAWKYVYKKVFVYVQKNRWISFYTKLRQKCFTALRILNNFIENQDPDQIL